MAICYFDGSAVVKRYAQETGTAWVMPMTLISADAALDAAAQTEGLAVDGPNLH
ncbi:MAG: hypothetical protein ACREAB_15570 [Blastocatellia bacterium]